MYYDWKPYVSVAQRRRNAMREMEKLRKKGRHPSPVVIEGRTIASTFWGKSWCTNLERYSDYANRLPRGRSYVRNGSVVDLEVRAGEVTALVSGSKLYQVSVTVSRVPKAHWSAICGDCAGAIDSLVELLQGRFSQGVMDRICQEEKGLFPSPKEIEFDCSCPDWASMCKHVAATLYGIGARLDEKPELLFVLRKVDEKAIIAQAGKVMPLAKKVPASDRLLDDGALSELFGIEMDAAPASQIQGRPPTAKRTKRQAIGEVERERMRATVSRQGDGRQVPGAEKNQNGRQSRSSSKPAKST